MSNFGMWHVHSEHSLLDGLGRVDDYVSQAKKLGAKGIAFSDHGTLAGAYQQWAAGIKHNFKVAVGVELYFAPEGIGFRDSSDWGSLEGRVAPGRYTHFTAYAMNAEGLRNLYRMQADAYEFGFYYKPRCDVDMLAKYSEGIIATTGCMGSVTSTWIRLERLDKAIEHAEQLKSIYGDRLYAEIMWHGVEGEESLNDGIVMMANAVGIPLLQTTDAHYVNEEDASAHDAFLCCQTGARISDEKRFRFSGDNNYHLKSYDEMIAAPFPTSTENSGILFDRIDFDSYEEVFNPGVLMPTTGVEGEDELLRELSHEGMMERLEVEEDEYSDFPEYIDRVNADLDIIIDGHYEGYFLVLSALMKEARTRGILFGPGRGSSSGCLPAYALKITDVDSIKHGTIMERFLNPKRKSLPDIDTDVAEHQRQDFIDLAVEMYGENNVAVIGTFGTIGAKAALEKAAKVLGYSFSEATAYKAHLPKAVFGVAAGLDKYTGPQDEVYELACKFEGLIQTQSQHAAGIIISPVDLRSRIPLWKKAGKGHWVTSFNMHEVEATGNVKLDFLGLSNLTTMDDALTYANVSWDSLPIHPDDCNDPKVYEALSSGSKLGVFQLESPLGRRTLKKVKPKSFSELRDILALVRPGAMDHIDSYAQRSGKMQPEWRFHPELESLDAVVEPSHSVLLMQEQVLQSLNILCGWDYGDADLVLSALRKKKHDKLAEAKPDYIRDGMNNGYSEEALEAFWQILLPFADYSFALAHSTAYALTTYRTAWLLVNYPNEYYAAMFSANNDDMEKLGPYLEDARANGISILPPDINESNYGFTPTKKGIRFGLSAIKGVGSSVIDQFNDVNITSLRHFYEAGIEKLNSRSVVSLIQAGALDSFGNRAEHVEKAGDWLELTKLHSKAASVGDRSLFKPKMQLSSGQTNREQLQEWEQELLGCSLTQRTLNVKLAQALTEDEWTWVASTLAQYPGTEKVNFSLRGANWTGQTANASARLATTLGNLSGVEAEVE